MFSADISVNGSFQAKATLIHESIHVWQKANGIDWGPDHKTTIRDDYRYTIDENTDFMKLNVEQQASIVEDYFRTTEAVFETGGVAPLFAIGQRPAPADFARVLGKVGIRGPN